MSMKWFWSPCRRYRASLCLLAGGALSEPEMSAVRAHLADCVGCRKYHDEIMSLAGPLAGWETNFAHVKPTRDAQIRWEKAIQEAATTRSVRRPEPQYFLLNCWRELIWPCRRIWTGLATAWVLILAANVSLNAHSPAIAKSGPSSEMMMTLKDQQKILAELLTDRCAPRDVDRQKSFSPKPHTERVEILTV